MAYLWIKALHVLAVITWMVGIFYIFRLFGYHTKHREEPSTVAVFREMEWKMLRIVMLPGALASIAFGVTMLVQNPELLSHRWLHVKLTAVLGLIWYHWYAERAAARLRRDDYVLTEYAARMLHAVPTVLLAVIVVMAVVKPF